MHDDKQDDRRDDKVRLKRWARWVGTFIGFPLAGVTARVVAGNIDSAPAALLGGLAGGAVLGAVQVGIGGMPAADRVRWIGATATGLAVGLTAGAATVGYDTDAASLVVMGAFQGAGVGLAQAVSVPMALRDRIAWALATPLLWAGGWAITSQVIVDADRQHAMFGSSGALAVSVLAGVLVAFRERVSQGAVLARGSRLERSEGCVMRRFAGFVVRRRRAVILFWVVLLLVAATIGSSAFSVLSTDFGAGTSTESGRVSQALDDMAETGGQLAIVADGVDIDDPSVQAAVAKGLAPIAELDGVISVVDPWSTGIDELKATDGRAALVVVTLSGDLDDEEQTAVAGRVEDLAHEVDAPEILVGGNVLVSETFAEASEADLLRGEAIALPIAIIVMVILLGGLVAAGMPLLVAIGGVFTTLAVLVGATYFGDVSIFSVNVVNMLGIGLGIDYGLLMVNRFREERGHGVELHEAVVNTVSSAGTTVVFSAFTVAVAMSGLFVFGVPLLTSFGIAGLSVVLLSMFAAVTLLPATLASVGGRIKPSAPVADAEGRFYRLTRWVQGRPVAVGGAAALVLVLLGIPFLSARFENGDARALPRSSEVRATALLLADRFPAHGADPVTVIAATDAKDPAFVAWLDSITANDEVVGHSIREGTPDGTTVVDLVATGTSQGAAATGLVDRIRSSDTSFATQVGGPAAELIDVKDKLSSRLPYAAALVCLATLLLLFLMTGSIIVPIKAVLMNILSLCASFGAMVWIFQEGHLSGPLGFTSVGALDLWMPVLILIFAFGLSMDYEVFLLSRIKEVHDETGDNDLAVAVGLQRSGRIITSAAALIVVVFAGFAAGEVLAIKQLGVGLAIAVIVDATLVRTLLVPATMKLLGERNWWAPAPLRRFHDRYGLHEAPSAPAGPTPAGPTHAGPTPGAVDLGEPAPLAAADVAEPVTAGERLTRHVVFGTGQVGGQVVAQLLDAGEEVVAVSRRGARFDGADNVAGDATDPTFAVDVCAGADVIYFCLDAPDYGRWPEQFPPRQRGVLAGARAGGPATRLVVLENLYGYGPVGGAPLVETMPLAATSAKARTRVAMTEELLDAHAAGEVQVVIGRASDYFGPGCTHSALGELVFESAVKGKAAQVMGDIDTRHSYSYTPDVARALIALGAADDDVTGQAWHLPVADAWTTREVIAHVCGLAGRRPKSFAAGRTSLRLYGLVNPAMKEYLQTLHQFTDDWIVDDGRFRTRFGDLATPMADALHATFDWFADRAPAEHR